MKKTILAAVIIVLIIILAFTAYYFMAKNNNQPAEPNENAGTENGENQSNEQQNQQSYEIQGMKVEILQQGTGEASKTGDIVTVNYVGVLQNGAKFDSSIDRNQPFSFTLGQNRVIQGWELGVLGMKAGEKRKLTIPPELAYGDQAVGGVIPANSTLIFEVELLKIN